MAPMPRHFSAGVAWYFYVEHDLQAKDPEHTHTSPYKAIPSANQLSVKIHKCRPAKQTKGHFILGVLIADRTEIWQKLCKLLRKH